MGPFPPMSLVSAVGGQGVEALGGPPHGPCRPTTCSPQGRLCTPALIPTPNLIHRSAPPTALCPRMWGIWKCAVHLSHVLLSSLFFTGTAGLDAFASKPTGSGGACPGVQLLRPPRRPAPPPTRSRSHADGLPVKLREHA